MRDDQKKRIDDLGETLMDEFLQAADPQSWSGAGKPPDEMDAATRGARNWDCKNANQIGALVARTLDLRDRMAGLLGPTSTPDPDAADADISKYEREAKRLMESLTGGRGKA